MFSDRDVSERRDTPDSSKATRLWEDLLTGLSLAVFVVLLICVLVGAWLYESGV
jgi:hypothetical protein